MRQAAALALVLAFASVAVAGPAPAPAADPNIARADAMFDEAQHMLESGNLEGACAKFEESLALNSQAIGTLLNVARCDARLGKLAHAVALYTEARDRGREQNLTQYVSKADEEIAKLTPFVPHLALAFVEPLADVQIVVDDKAVTVAGAADLPLDPGAHKIAISAPGRVPHEEWIKLAKSEHRAMSIAPLAYPVTIHPTHSSRGAIGMFVTIGGGVMVATGITLGLVAKNHYDSALAAGCDGAANCTPDGFQKTQSARSLGNAGSVVGAVGILGVAAGVAVWFTAPKDRVERGVSFAPIVAPGEAGVVAVGRF